MNRDGSGHGAATGRVSLVWVDGWQMDCCGVAFSVGRHVEWTVHDEPDREWLAARVGEDLAARVTHAEEHHTWDDDAHLTPIAGSVTRIRAVCSRYAPDPADPTGRVHVPVPGTTTLDEVSRAAGWHPAPDDGHFDGYLVDLRTRE